MKVLYVPDYRVGVGYQTLLAGALAAQGVQVDFPRGHRRVLPLWRGVASWHGDLVHMHWPEKFFEIRRDGLDYLRKARYPADLALARRHHRLVMTAHDFLPHNRAGESMLRANFQLTYNAAGAVFVHSRRAADIVTAEYGVEPARLHVIRHGDLSPSLGALPPRDEARAALGLGASEPVCLLFGTVEPYKGIEPVLDWWRAQRRQATLVVAGKPLTGDYETSIRDRAGSAPGIRLELGWQTDDALRRWLAAADCVLFHYRAIFTSGAACLARSLGIPILIPRRLETVDLAEPHPLVTRFEALEEDFAPALARTLERRRDPDAAAPWRAETAWPRIAEQTAEVYRSMGPAKPSAKPPAQP